MLNKLVRLYICIFAVSTLFIGCAGTKQDSNNQTTPIVDNTIINDNASDFSQQQLNYQIKKLTSEINYLNGKPFGSTKIWRKDGKLRSNFVIRENGRRYGLAGIKRCTKINIKEEIIDPYLVMRWKITF